MILKRGGLHNEASVSLRSPMGFFPVSLCKQVCSGPEKIKALMLGIKAL